MYLILILILGLVILSSVGYLLIGDTNGQGAAVKRAQSLNLKGNGTTRLAKNTLKSSDDRRKQILDQIKSSEKLQKQESYNISNRMIHAGLEPNINLFWGISLGLGVIVFLSIWLFSHNALLIRLGLALGAAFTSAYGLPRWILSAMTQMRVKKFTENFPNAMDILVRGIKSGLPVADGLKVIAREVPAPLGPEFQRVLESMSMGLSIEGALEKMGARMPAPEIRFFTTVIAIQSKTGGNLAEALTNLSNVIRSRKMLREKIKALSSEAVATATIIGSLPFVVAVLISFARPGYLNIMFTDSRGQMILILGGVWMAIGITSIRKMIAFKF